MLIGSELIQEYDGTLIIRGVTIAVCPGAVTVLIGKSGSGKSTLLRTLSLVDPPRSGRVSIGERQLFPAATARPAIAPPWPDITVVFQQFFLWPHVTVRQNITLPAQLRGKAIDHADELCSDLGISDLVDRYPNQVSVGQRQRAALARSLLLRPSFLLLDEITSAQDVQHVSLILDVLCRTLAAGLGLLVVTHHLGFAKRLLSLSTDSKVVYLDCGCVVESGGHDCLDHPSSEGLQAYVKLSRDLR